jgi:hypothetical protein
MNKNTWKKETAGSSEMSIQIYQTALLHIIDGPNLNVLLQGSVESQQRIKFVHFFIQSTAIFSYFAVCGVEEAA